jgi:hypothetical protein
MTPMPRPAIVPASLVLGALLVALQAPSPAQAQTEPPPTPPGAAAIPPAPAAAPTPPAAEPPLAAPPVPAAPPPAPAATTMMAAPGELAPLPPAEEKPPIYKQTWFWAVVGVVVLTATMITIGIASQGPSTPATDLGNMRAF